MASVYIVEGIIGAGKSHLLRDFIENNNESKYVILQEPVELFCKYKQLNNLLQRSYVHKI